MQGLLRRVLLFPMPSLCVIQGHCYAGGLIFAMCHDFRVMREQSGRLCLSEINVGLPLPRAYDMVCSSLMPRQIYREMAMGRALTTTEALSRNVITAVFKTPEELGEIVKQFEQHYPVVDRAIVQN